MFGIRSVTRCFTWTLASVATAVAVSRGTTDDKNKPEPPAILTAAGKDKPFPVNNVAQAENVKVPFDEKKAKELVDSLDSLVYREREKAYKQLFQNARNLDWLDFILRESAKPHNLELSRRLELL